MKKVIITAIAAIAMLSSLALTAAAEQQTVTLKADFSELYITSMFDGNVKCRYNPASSGVGCRASTDLLNIPDEEYAWSYASVTALNNESATSYDGKSGKQCNGILNSGRAIVNGQSYAKRALHDTRLRNLYRTVLCE